MVLSVLQNRRSIRKFLKKKVESETIDQIIEAALRSPSGRGINPWEFIVVTDEGILEKLSMSKEHGSAFLKNAPLGIVVCADPGKQDIWIEDAAIASIIIHLAAASLGLGSCWIQIRERMFKGNEPAEPYIIKLLNLPPHLKILSIVAIGYPDEQKPPHPKEKLPYEKIHREAYSKKVGI